MQRGSGCVQGTMSCDDQVPCTRYVLHRQEKAFKPLVQQPLVHHVGRDLTRPTDYREDGYFWPHLVARRTALGSGGYVVESLSAGIPEPAVELVVVLDGW